MLTLLAYLALMLSSMACMLFLWKSSGVIWTKSAILVCFIVAHTACVSDEGLGKQDEEGVPTRMNILRR